MAALHVQGPGVPIYPLSPVSFPQMRQEKAVAAARVRDSGQRVGCDAARRCDSNSSAPHAPNGVCEAFSAAESEVGRPTGLVSVKWDVGGGDGGGGRDKPVEADRVSRCSAARPAGRTRQGQLPFGGKNGGVREVVASWTRAGRCDVKKAENSRSRDLEIGVNERGRVVEAGGGLVAFHDFSRFPCSLLSSSKLAWAAAAARRHRL